jgi:hypothetical protein
LFLNKKVFFPVDAVEHGIDVPAGLVHRLKVGLQGTGRNDNAALVYVLGTGRMANPKRKEKGKRFHVRFVLHGFNIYVRQTQNRMFDAIVNLSMTIRTPIVWKHKRKTG